MKIALLGTGFGQAHAAMYAARPDVDEVIAFGRAPAKLATIAGQFGFATTTDLAAVLSDDLVDLVDVCLPTRLHADVAVRAMQAGRDVLIELPLAATLADAERIVAAQRSTGRRAFVDMFGRFSPANRRLRLCHHWLCREAKVGQRDGCTLTVDRVKDLELADAAGEDVKDDVDGLLLRTGGASRLYREVVVAARPRSLRNRLRGHRSLVASQAD